MLKDKGIILKVYKHGEANLIVHLLDPKGSKVKLLAPSALLSKKRFAGGVLQPSHYVKICYKQARNEEGLGTLTEATLINGFEKIRTSYDRVLEALHFLQLVDRISLEGESDAKNVFNLLGNALSALETSENLPVLKIHFELKLLHSQGMVGADKILESFFKTPLEEHQNLTDLESLKYASSIARTGLTQYL